MVNIILEAQLSQFSTATLQIKPVLNSWSLKRNHDQSHMMPVFSDLRLYAPMWSMHIRTVHVNASSAQWWWSSVGGLSCSEAAEVIMLSCRQPPSGPPACWWDAVATALSHGTLLWSCVNQAAGLESTADPGVWTSSNQTPEPNWVPEL